MPIDQTAEQASEARSTRAAADVLAAETKAFGNASAKLSLQMATDNFLRAKEAFLKRAVTNENIAQEEK